MFKKTLAIILCALMLATVAVAESYAVPEPGSPFTLEGDMGLYLDGTWFPVLREFTALKDVLGEPDEMEAAPSCAFIGDDKSFYYDGIQINTNPVGDMDYWMEAIISGEGYTTPRGIGVGASKDEIIAAYGDGYYEEGDDMIIYSVSGVAGDFESPCIMFIMDGDSVYEIDLYYPTNNI